MQDISEIIRSLDDPNVQEQIKNLPGSKIVESYDSVDEFVYSDD